MIKISAIINFKICDNSPECSGLSVCPTEAIYWDEKLRSLVIDNSKCIACGACAKACPVKGAILVAKTKEEFKKFKEQIENDPRTRADLLRERYNAEPVDLNLVVDDISFEEDVLESDKVVIVDFWNMDNLGCRVDMIPYDEIVPKKVVLPAMMKTKDLKFKFKKMNVETNPKTSNKYQIKTIPSLMVFYQGKEVGRIEGSIPKQRKRELQKKIESIFQKLNN